MNQIKTAIILAALLPIVSVAETLVAVEKEIMPFISNLIESQNIEVTLKESDDVQQELLKGESMIGISSEKWLDVEMAQFVTRYGRRPVILYFTADVAAVVVHPDNPAESVTIQEVRDAFGCHEQQQYNRWQNDITEIEYMLPFVVEGESEWHKRFSSMMECAPSTYSTVQYLPDREALEEKVSSEPEAIGYTLFTAQETDLKIVDIVADDGKTYSFTKETVLSGRYPLSNVYYMYLAPEAAKLSDEGTPVEPMVTLALDTEKQQQYSEFGFLSLLPAAVSRNQVQLKMKPPVVKGGYK